jgi:hypothetical protein
MLPLFKHVFDEGRPLAPAAVGPPSENGGMKASAPRAAPWVRALHEFTRLVESLDVEWMLVGSAATASRGVDLVPADLDVLVPAPQDVEAIASVMPGLADDDGDADPGTFLSSKARPVLVFADGAWSLGRWCMDHVRVEVVSIRAARPDRGRLLETAGGPVWLRREPVSVFGVWVPTVPLEVQIATMVARGQQGRLARVMDGGTGRLRPELLREALHGRGLDEVALLPSPLQRLLLS